MEIGLHLPSAQPAANAEDVLEVATTAESLGFDGVWMFDHLFTPTGLESKYPYSRDGSYAMTEKDPFFDPLGAYGVLAGATKRVKLGTGVMVGAYRHPIVLGKALATIENFAPGRIVLGLGTGWMREEFEALDVPYEKRGAVLDDYIVALRAVWSAEPTAHDGEFYSWQEAGFLPAPTQPIPIIIGGHSDKALHRAARLGDGWAVVTGKGQGRGLDGAQDRIDVVRDYLEKEDRDPENFHLLFQHPMWFSDSPNPKLPFTGPADAIAGSLKRAADMGITMVDLVVFGPRDMIVETAQRFTEEVKPLL